MKFSIIVPLYNVEQYLPKCLESLQQQTYQDFEVICVNDGSMDNSAAIAEEWKARFDNQYIIIHQENQGLSAARNTGLNASQGDYVLFLDSDDWLESNALQLLSDNLDDEDMLCFNGRRYFEDTKQYEEADSLKQESNLSGWEYYCRHALDSRRFAFVCVVLRCYKREFLLKSNLLFKPGIFHEDNLFTPYACYYAQKVSVISDVLYDYRVRSSSIMTSRSLKHWKDILGTANELAAFFQDKSIDKTTIYQALTHHYQAAFASVGREEDKELLPLVDWKLYKMVSRTKRRHRIQYVAMRISPNLFRLINRF